MSIVIEEIALLTSPSGTVIIPPSSWINVNTPVFYFKEPSGYMIKGYSVSLVEPNHNTSLVPDMDEITNEGGAWIFGGSDFTWDSDLGVFDNEFGWNFGRWYDGTPRQNFWDIAASGIPPSGILL